MAIVLKKNILPFWQWRIAFEKGLLLVSVCEARGYRYWHSPFGKRGIRVD